MDNWIEIVGKVGFPIAVALYLLWQTRKDKEAMETRVSGLDDFIKNDLKSISEKSTEVISANTQAIQENTKVLEKCKMYLSNRGGT